MRLSTLVGHIRTAIALNENIVKTNFTDVYDQITGKKTDKKKFKKEEATFVKTREPLPDTKITICDKYFDIITEKKEKIALVPYNIIIQLKNQKERVLKYNFSNIRAKLLYKDKVILKDKLKSLVQYFDKIDLENGVNTKFPKTPLLYYPDDWNNLFASLNLLLKPTQVSHKSNKIGFLSLRNLGENNYEYYLEKDFFVAIEETLTSIEAIFDNDVVAWNDKEKKVIETVHHKLNKLSEEMDV